MGLMAQTRRMGIATLQEQLPQAPRFSPYQTMLPKAGPREALFFKKPETIHEGSDIRIFQRIAFVL
jgi:hypothetical protein